MTESMISKANGTAEIISFKKTDFLLCDIENMPLENELSEAADKQLRVQPDARLN
jgi:hypothetical protein